MMAENPLHRPVWNALTTSQAQFAQGSGKARRFLPAIGPLAGMADDGEEALADLARLCGPGEEIWAVLAGDLALPAGLEILWRRDLVLMVHQGGPAPEPDLTGLIPLGPDHAQAMVDLAMLTKPGPFALRTGELGPFWGRVEDGQLVAMAGERMKLPGFGEISGVATHPDYQGRGLGGRLMALKLAHILARGEVPFLHSYADNAAAITLYERMGFAVSHPMVVTALRRA